MDELGAGEIIPEELRGELLDLVALICKEGIPGGRVDRFGPNWWLQKV
jgi:hypothetical protein